MLHILIVFLYVILYIFRCVCILWCRYLCLSVLVGGVFLSTKVSLVVYVGMFECISINLCERVFRKFLFSLILVITVHISAFVSRAYWGKFENLCPFCQRRCRADGLSDSLKNGQISFVENQLKNRIFYTSQNDRMILFFKTIKKAITLKEVDALVISKA